MGLHPEVFFAPGEVPYLESPDYEHWGTARLHELFANRPERILGIKRPNYIGLEEIPDRLRQHLPDAKLMAVLRHPAKRAVAQYYHNMRFGFQPVLPLDRGLGMIFDDNRFVSRYPAASTVLEYGRYGKYLPMYQHYSSRNQMLVLFHDDVAKEAAGTIREALKFVGASEHFFSQTPGNRPQKVAYSLLRIRVLRLANPFLFKYNKTRTRLEPRPSSRTTRSVAAFISKLDGAFGFAKAAAQPKPGNKVRQKLIEYYRDEVKLVGDMTDRDLGHWCRWDD